MTLVDTNVLVDVFGRDSRWWAWSLAQMETATLNGPLLINDVIYAEASIRYRDVEHLDATLSSAGIRHTSIPRAALFLAGKAFARYRQSGGTRTGLLPDFFIGAHAALEGLPLLTRDARRYRTYFPSLRLIAPD